MGHVSFQNRDLQSGPAVAGFVRAQMLLDVPGAIDDDFI